MISVALDTTEVKGFMNRLLREEILDAFEVRGVELGLETRISINGAIEPPADAAEDNPEQVRQNLGYTTWEALRPLVFTIIKAGVKPRMIKIVFSCKPLEAQAIHSNAAALFLNMVYENDSVAFTTATSQKAFALDKSLDDAWDEWVRVFFASKQITVTDRE